MDRLHAFVPAGSTATGATARALRKGGEFIASDGELKLRVPAPGYPGGPVSLGIRAEDLTLQSRAAPGSIAARVDVVEHLGSEDLIHLNVGTTRLVVRCATAGAPTRASEVFLHVPAAHCHFFERPPGGADGARLKPPRPVAPLELVS